MISLIHPSRNRPQKAFYTMRSWMAKSSGKIEIEHILSTDVSDHKASEYLPLFKDSMILINPNDCVVQATNYAAKESKGDILIYLSDDFDCPQNWDTRLYEIFASKKEPCLLKVDDGLQKFEKAVLTIPIMNRMLYEKLGYFWHPEYKSMHVDVDLYYTCRTRGWITFAPSLKFQHMHWINKMTVIDETYKRSEAHWDQGERVLQKRTELNFPL